MPEITISPDKTGFQVCIVNTAWDITQLAELVRKVNSVSNEKNHIVGALK